MRRVQLMGTVLLLLLILGLAASTALSNPPPQEPPPPSEIRLTAEDDGRQIELSEGQVLVVSLEGNPSTGYLWEVEEVDEKILRQAGEIEFQQESNLLGSPAKQIMRFQAVGEGQTALTLVYRRPWEEGVEPLKTFSLQVRAVGPFTGVYSPPATPMPPPPKSSAGSPVPVADQPQLGLPSSFNWCDGGYCTPVKDQGYCGSCWAFGTVGPFESKVLIHDAVTTDFSEQYLVSCNTDGWDCCGGWWAHDYHQSLIPPGEPEAGAVMETAFPYGSTFIDCLDPEVPCSGPYAHPYEISSWAYVGPEDGIPPAEDIKQAIYDHGPVSVAVCVGTQFQLYTSGVFATDESGDCGINEVNHAVVLVGWNDTDGAWILRNSWGSGWGESGYMRIAYGVSNVGYSANYIVYTPSIPLPNKVYLPLVLKNYPGWATIVSENFEGAWPGSWDLWEGGDGDYKWNKRNCRPYGGSYSGWAVGGGANGSLLACQANYPNNAYSWMIYGPFSLVGATAADLQFKLWLNSELNYDGVCRAASINGTNFYGPCTSGNSGGWIDRVLDLSNVPTLGNLLGQSQVWVALIFDSDPTINKTEGGYVDNIVLRKYVGTGMPAAPVSGVAPLPEGAEIVETPATFVLKP